MEDIPFNKKKYKHSEKSEDTHPEPEALIKIGVNFHPLRRQMTIRQATCKKNPLRADNFQSNLVTCPFSYKELNLDKKLCTQKTYQRLTFLKTHLKVKHEVDPLLIDTI